MENIKNRLLKALSMRGMTPAELARASGIDKGSISRYLSGKFEPKQSAVHAMAKALNVSPSWLLGYDVPVTPDFTAKYTEQDKELNMLIEKLSPDELNAVKAIIKTILNKGEKADDNSEI